MLCLCYPSIARCLSDAMSPEQRALEIDEGKNQIHQGKVKRSKSSILLGQTDDFFRARWNGLIVAKSVSSVPFGRLEQWIFSRPDFHISGYYAGFNIHCGILLRSIPYVSLAGTDSCPKERENQPSLDAFYHQRDPCRYNALIRRNGTDSRQQEEFAASLHLSGSSLDNIFSNE